MNASQKKKPRSSSSRPQPGSGGDGGPFISLARVDQKRAAKCFTKTFFSVPNNGLLRNLDNDGKKL